ncbi:glycosyltransferase [Bradyrhizobium sp. HKCCYLRH3099]|uniref:glycosyltransferase n=1 Tax=unclassified Bradyrhizobium TaxID=2631580 RepID=UPI003EBE3099
MSLRFTIVQYAGDYREAFERLSAGGKETYYAQRHSVDFVGSLVKQLEQVAVICAVSDTTYDTMLANGVRAIGAGLRPGFDPASLVPFIANTSPNRLSVNSPLAPVLRWAIGNRIRTIVPLADSFNAGGLRAAIRHRLLARQLNHPLIEWVGNHGISACLSLAGIGVHADKIVPWDWPPAHRPSDYPSRSLAGNREGKIFYVGSLSHAKGVGDLLNATAMLRGQGYPVSLSLAGRDGDGSMAALARSLGILDVVRFLGVVANEDVPRLMQEADLVVIPSRHDYPEGLPLTIYEALSARTPIVASDHPMFRTALAEGESAVIFKAGDLNHLAASIVKVLDDPVLYQTLSARSEEAWTRIQLPVTMSAFVAAWLEDTPAKVQWLRAHNLLSDRYNHSIRDRL